jgi:hypothetical protein
MRTLNSSCSLQDLAGEVIFSGSLLKANPLTTALAGPFDSLLGLCTKAISRELELTLASALSAARATQADTGLNSWVDLLHRTLLALTHDERDTPLYQSFFGNQKPSVVKRPVLGEQLTLMHEWMGLLERSTVPQLVALKPSLEAALKEGDAAQKAQQSAAADEQHFFELGDCKSLLDQANALRKLTYGKLAELLHAKPEANLPSDFAELFFLRESRWTPQTKARLEKAIARTEQQLARQRQQLADLQAREQLTESARKKAEAAAVRAELAAVEKRAAEEQARVVALKAQLSGLTGQAHPSSPPPA